MADTRLTKINFWRKLYLMLIATIAPKRFIEEQKKDDEERKNFPQPPPPRGHNIFRIRRAFWISLLLVVVSIISGYALGCTINYLFGCFEKTIINVLQIIGAFILLCATLFVRGWDIQSFGGVTLAERVNQWIYRSLYFVGTAIIVFSLSIKTG